MNLLECVDLIEETKENSKNALIEKGVELDDSYKLSEVDEKIAEIEAGGGKGFNYLEYGYYKVDNDQNHGRDGYNYEPTVKNGCYKTFKFKTGDYQNLKYEILTNYDGWQNKISDISLTPQAESYRSLLPNTEYTVDITATQSSALYVSILVYDGSLVEDYSDDLSPADCFTVWISAL